MNRRSFLRTFIGGTTIAAVAPSMVWPFRKIFLPAQPTKEFFKLDDFNYLAWDSKYEVWYLNPEQAKAIEEIMEKLPEYLTGTFPALEMKQCTYANGLYRATPDLWKLNSPRSNLNWLEFDPKNVNVLMI